MTWIVIALLALAAWCGLIIDRLAKLDARLDALENDVEYLQVYGGVDA